MKVKVKEQMIDEMEETRRDWLIRNIREAAGETDSMDVTLVCKDGLHVRTHVGLMAALSKRMGELFTTLTTFPVVVIVPDLTKAVVEKLLNLYRSEWEEAEVDVDLMEAAEILGLPLPVARYGKSANIKSWVEKSIEREIERKVCLPPAGKEKPPEVKASRPTMLVRVKRERNESVFSDEESDSENSDFESEQYIESALQGKVGINTGIDTAEGTEAGLECDQCGTKFEDKDSLKIHIGEVHMEQQLLTELFLTFPGGTLSLTCVGCGEECGSDYEKKEHILLNHPWPSLKAQAEEIVEASAEKGAKNETNNEDLRIALVTHSESLLSIQNDTEVDVNHNECDICGTTFESSEGARIHIGEVHKEKELLSELVKTFPGGSTKCKECGEKSGSEYEKKEHILLQHPWRSLVVLDDPKTIKNLENATNKKEQDGVTEADNEDIDANCDKEKEAKVLEKREKWFQHSTNYSCNHCDNKFSEPTESKRHLEKAHNIKKGHSDHVTHAKKKYVCKICLSSQDHNLSAIRSHMRRSHNLDVKAYEAKYEKASNIQPGLKTNEKDVLGELCEPAKGLVSFLKETKRRKSKSGNSDQNLKRLKPLREKEKLERQIEFSDSSDEEK